MLKLDAHDIYLEYESERSGVFCPLFGNNCYITCECYQPSYIDCKSVEINQDELVDLDELDIWFVRKGYCTAYTLKGPKKGDN